jgi:hypothetical protein
MKKLLALLCSLFGGVAIGGDQNKNLEEFSTSMDFEEFNVVLNNLNTRNSKLASELADAIKTFKETTQPGESRQSYLESGHGHITLEREDEYAFGIAIFTSKEVSSQLDSAYEAAISELNI